MILLDTSQELEEEASEKNPEVQIDDKQESKPTTTKIETEITEITEIQIGDASNDLDLRNILDTDERNQIASSQITETSNKSQTSTENVSFTKLNDKKRNDEQKIKTDKTDQDNQDDSIGDNQNADNTTISEVEEDRKSRESTASKLTLLSMGAPVPSSLNGQKPPLENFSVGMGELIYFENLPTSTGVFDKLRKVIKKIRKKIT